MIFWLFCVNLWCGVDLRFGGLWIADCYLGLLGLGFFFFLVIIILVAGCCLDLGLQINKLGYCLVGLLLPCTSSGQSVGIRIQTQYTGIPRLVATQKVPGNRKK
jgi:hypothetical protein